MSYKEQDLHYVLQTYKRNPICFEYGKGAVLYAEHKDYIDFMAGIAVCSVGHGNQKLAQAIYEQATKLIHVSNLYGIPNQAALAQKLVELSGFDMAVFFCNSGAEANEAAIKIARKYGHKKGRFKIISLYQSFHGRTIATLKATGQTKMHTPSFAPYPDGFVYADNIEHIYSLLDDQTVAVILELIKGEGGIQSLDKQQLQALCKHLKSKDILLLIDEVQSGIYRTGEFLASNVFDIYPDVISIAKGLAGGIPIGAVMTKHKTIFEAGEHGSTFGGNPLSTRAALCVLEILQDFKDSKQLQENIALFHTQLDNIKDRFQQFFERKVGIGFMCGLECKNAHIQEQIINKCFDKRLLVLRSGEQTIRFVPPLTISTDEINEGFKRLEQACEQACNEMP